MKNGFVKKRRYKPEIMKYPANSHGGVFAGTSQSRRQALVTNLRILIKTAHQILKWEHCGRGASLTRFELSIHAMTSGNNATVVWSECGLIAPIEIKYRQMEDEENVQHGVIVRNETSYLGGKIHTYFVSKEKTLQISQSALYILRDETYAIRSGLPRRLYLSHCAH